MSGTLMCTITTETTDCEPYGFNRCEYSGDLGSCKNL